MKRLLAVVASLALAALLIAPQRPAWAGGPGAPAAGTEEVALCSWDSPGHNPFMGDVVAAIDRYADIAPAVRARLKARMAQRDYDEIVSIRRDAIEGRHRYDPRITEMHFGWRSVCREVTRAGWTEQMQERGLVYCDSGQCILVPTVCRNVSRIVRQPEAVADDRAEDVDPLAFDPPGAGVPAVAAGSVDHPSFAMASAGAGHEPPALTPVVGGAPITFAPVPPGGEPGHDTPWTPGGEDPPGGSAPPGFNEPPPNGHGPWTPPPHHPEVPPPAVPEPTRAALLIAGLGVLMWLQRRAGKPSSSTQKRS